MRLLLAVVLVLVLAFAAGALAMLELVDRLFGGDGLRPSIDTDQAWGDC